MSNNSLVFDIQGVSQADVEAVEGSTRTDYKYVGGHYLADSTDLNIETDFANNKGVLLNTIYSNNAEVKTNNTDLTVKDGFIDEYATFVNGNLNASDYNHIAIVNNRTKAIVSPHYQMYTKKTGDFSIGMDGTVNMTTDAPVVHYNPDLNVNGFNNENSFTRLTLKENIVQQVAKDIDKRVTPQEVSSLRAIPVKLDTSNIIINEINNNLSREYNTEDNKNISINTGKEENLRG